MNTNRSNTKQYTYIFASCTVLHAHTPNGREFKTSATVCHEKGFLNAGLSVSWNNVVCRVLFFSDKQMFLSLSITKHCLLRKAKRKNGFACPVALHLRWQLRPLSRITGVRNRYINMSGHKKCRNMNMFGGYSAIWVYRARQRYLIS